MKKTRLYLCYLLEVDYKTLNYALDKSNYINFKIKKRSGGIREISAPDDTLKFVQKQICKYIEKNYEFLPCQYGFIKGKSIVNNAEVHKRANYILNIDLKNFFPTINFGRVRGMFMAEPFNLNNGLATLLAKLACFNNQLPQGSPSSPIISNVICYTMDKVLLELTKKYNITYSRYADDMTLSSNELLPKEIAFRTIDNYIIIGRKLKYIIERQGFIINENKTSLSRFNERKEVTGLIINEKVNVKKVFIKQLRSLLHHAEVEGLLSSAKIYYNINTEPSYIKTINLISNIKKVIEGKLNFLAMIRGKDNLLYLKYYHQYQKIIKNNNISSKEKSFTKRRKDFSNIM